MLEDKITKAKEFVINEKKNIIIAIVLLVACFVAYNVFSKPISDQRGTGLAVESNIRSTGSELNRAGQAITNSQSISTEIRRTNQNIEQSNQLIRQSIENSQSINRDSHSLTREGKQILSTLPRAE